MLDQLPVEILGEVVKHLDAQDINSLLSIPRFKQVLAGKVLFLSHSQMLCAYDFKSQYGNLPFQSYTDESSLSKLLAQDKLQSVFCITVFTELLPHFQLFNSMIKNHSGNIPKTIYSSCPSTLWQML